MPESRKRKKKSQKPRKAGGHPARRQKRTPAPAPQRTPVPDLLARTQNGPTPNLLDQFATERQRNEEARKKRAESLTGDLINEVVAFQAGRDDHEVEDELCRRLGEIGIAHDHHNVDDHLDINDLLNSLLSSAQQAVSAALAESGSDVTGPWRVLVATTNVSVGDALEDALEAITKLLERDGRHRAPAGPQLTGEFRWAHDNYGSRFGVLAPFTTSDGPERWYLWDVDACDYEVATVFSGYFSAADQAEQAWRDGVGPMAASSDFSAVDDHALVSELLPYLEGIFRSGGEDENQLAEYSRGRRLAYVLREHLGPGTHVPQPNKEEIAEEFSHWLTDHDVELDLADSLDEVAGELAETWAFNSPGALFWTCSPHRVARVVAQVRDYYLDDFAQQILTLAPHWVTWLGEKSGTPPELVDRSMTYAHGEPHHEVEAAEKRKLRARITE